MFNVHSSELEAAYLTSRYMFAHFLQYLLSNPHRADGDILALVPGNKLTLDLPQLPSPDFPLSF